MTEGDGAAPPTPGGSYYWASGRRVALAETDLVAVDLDQAGDARQSLQAQSSQAVSGNVVLLAEVEARTALGAGIASQPGVHPVYTADGAVLVVLPEVRVEGSAEVLDRVRREAGDGVDVDDDDVPGRLVLRPASGRGEDALRLANEVTETVAPELAQCRFVRITPRPQTG